MTSLEDKYKAELKNQIKRTKEIIIELEKATKQFSMLWYIAGYIAILVSIITIKIFFW